MNVSYSTRALCCFALLWLAVPNSTDAQILSTQYLSTRSVISTISRLSCPHHQPPLSEDPPYVSLPSQQGTHQEATVSSTSRPTPTSQKSTKKSWPTDTFTYTTNVGTWMDLSLSPDGKQIVFDILGDIYTLAIAGGKARRITKGPAYDTQPQWSPDGRFILFTSDRKGASNVWLMRPDGRQMRRLSSNVWGQINMPVWSPDGTYYVYRKKITDRRSVGVVELWMQHIWGGKGFRLTKGSQIGDANEPSFSPDGRYIYFAARGRHRYNRNVHRGIWNIIRLDVQTKKRLLITRNASRPTVSPDGKWLALVRRIGKRSVLLTHNLKTGRESSPIAELDRDDQEGFAVDGTYPSLSWFPNSQALLYTAQGKLWRVSTSTRIRKGIPFTAQIQQKIRRSLRTVRRIGHSTFSVKMLRWARLAPNKKRVFWSALGRIWTATWPRIQNIRRLLPKHTDLVFAPALQADGKRIAYVTWNDTKRGHVWVRPLDAQGRVGQAVQVTATAGYYSNPSFSQDGSGLTFVRASGSEARGLSPSWQPWQQILYVDLRQTLPTSKTSIVATLRNRGTLSHMPRPHFSKDGKRIYFSRIHSKRYKRYTTLCSRRLDGTVEQRYVSIYAGEDIQVSPDEKWFLFSHLHHIYLSVLPTAQKRALPLRISNGAFSGSPLPILHLSSGDDGGNWPHWSTSKEFTWSLGQTLYTSSLQRARKALYTQSLQRSKNKSKAKKKQKVKLYRATRIPFSVQNPRPKGWLALTDVRIITMKGNKIIPKGTILIYGNRIQGVGASHQVKIPSSARIVSYKGKTAIPGMIDVHAHLHYGALDIHPQQSWAHQVNLAYGVTTVHDPSASTELVFSQAERTRSGQMVGPRIFSTGFILYGAENTHKAVIRKRQDAVHHIRRLKRVGAWSVKSYMQPTRKQRQWVMEAARSENMLLYPEGGGRMDLNMSMILDGHTGIEHALPYASIYQDVIRFFASSQTGYTPTLLVSYGGVFGENYFHQFHPAWKDKKLQRWIPQRILASITRRRSTLILDQDWHFKRVAAHANSIQQAGGRVQIGSHGQLQGLGFHWEIFALHKGGMSAHDVLRSATLHGALYLGLEKDLGSIEKGKLADIVILSKDPLKKIQHTKSIHHVIQNGFVYDGETLQKQN